MNRIQELLLGMMIDVDKVLSDHGVVYYLDSGTAIGAVRHKGFIPWDDDVDFAIRCDDEQRMVEALKDLPKEKYLLIEPFSIDWPFDFYKVKMKGTEAIEVDQGRSRIHRGLSIDLFTYKPFPRSSGRKHLYYGIMDVCKVIEYFYRLCYGRRYMDRIQSIVRYVLRAQYRLMDMIAEQDTNLSLPRLSFISRNIEIEDAWLGTPEYMEFEGHMFPVYEEYDKVLTRTFGDYMQLPPEDQRKTHIISFREFDEE